MLVPVERLSDDEADVAALPPAKRAKRPGVVKHQKALQLADLQTVNPVRLRNLINSKCGCSGDCFAPIRTSITKWDKWLETRKLLAKMTKLEKDENVGVPAQMSTSLFINSLWASKIATCLPRSFGCSKAKTEPVGECGISSMMGIQCATLLL